jgi:hypothetical protein
MPYGADARRKRDVMANCSPSIVRPAKPSAAENSVQKPRAGGEGVSMMTSSGARVMAR